MLELPVGECAFQVAKGIGQTAIVPLVVLGIVCVEQVPERVSLNGIVAGNGSHIGQFVTHGHDLGVKRGVGNLVYGLLLALVPGTLIITYALNLNKRCDAVTEFPADIVDGDIGILDCVMQRCCGHEFLVRCDGRDNLHCLQGVYNIGETLSAALRARVGLDRKHDGAVKKFCIEWFVGHCLFVHERQVLGLLQKHLRDGVVTVGFTVKLVEHILDAGLAATHLEDVCDAQVLRADGR